MSKLDIMKIKCSILLLVASMAVLSSTLANLPKSTFNDSDLNECMSITMMMLDSMITQDSPQIRRFCTKDFRALLTKGLTPEPGGVCALDSDFRFDSQDDTPLIEQVGPPEAVDQRRVKVPVRMKKLNGTEFTKVWVYEHETALMRCCDVLTCIPSSETGSSLSKELSHLR